MAAAELRPVYRPVIGPADQVRNVLISTEQSGRLVSMTPLRPAGNGLVRVDLVVLEPAMLAPPARTPVRPVQWPAEPRRRSRRAPVIAACVALALALLAVLGVVVVGIVQWVIAHFAVIVGVLAALAALVLFAAVKTGGCPGLHCPGCDH